MPAKRRSTLAEPVLRDSTRKEADSFLARNHLGRIVFSFRDIVDVRPIHYVYAKGWIFGRTSVGNKLETLRHNQWVAFEVDEASGPFDWESVIARGTFYRLNPDGSAVDVKLYRRALRLIRKAAPLTFRDDDPVAFRTELFGISVDSMTGKSSSTRARR